MDHPALISRGLLGIFSCETEILGNLCQKTAKKKVVKFRGRGNIMDDFTIISNDITYIIGIILKGRKWRVH